MDKQKKLTILKKSDVAFPDSPDNARLEVFDNPSPGNSYTIEFETSEFTSLCPVTSQPDFAAISINYTPSDLCIESKSLKLYLFSYRSYHGFAEAIVNRILDDIVEACSPQKAAVRGCFTARGGITINVEAVYGKEDK